MNEDEPMSAQIITTPSGDRLVLLPEADYLDLLVAAEDAADRDAARRWQTALAAGEEEALPADLVNRVLGDASPVRAWREYRGMTAQALAESSGIAKSYLSQIETGKRDGTLDTMAKLAAALNVLVDDLLPVKA
jgi:DNA-binding XRE family transcriptional regulator